MDEGILKMSTGLRNIILFLILSMNTAAQTVPVDAQIITSSELESSGITLLSDIYQLLDKWNSSTIDGFNWLVSSNGLSPYQRQRFRIIVDEHPVDLNILDNQNINLLPFSVNQIDFIEVLSTPQLIGGDFIEAGLIHIHLKKPYPKLTSHIVYSTGNETGDPGPYKFTSYSSPNIDKINTVFSGDLKYGSKNWNLQAGIKQEDNFDTDLRIRKRIQYYSKSINKAQLVSGFGNLSVSGKKSKLNLISFYTDQNDYFHLKYYGNEIPVNRTSSLAAMNGTFQLNNRIKLNYLLQTGRNKLAEWQGYNPDWNNTKLRSDLGLEYQLNSFVFNGGVSLRKNVLLSSIDRYNISFRNLYAEMKYQPGIFSSHKISFYTVSYKDKTTYKFALSHYLRFHKNHSLTGAISLFTRMPEEDLNFLCWNLNGYTLENNMYSVHGELKTGKTFTGDVDYKFKMDSSITSELGFFYRRFHDHYLEDQIYSYNYPTGNFFSFIKIMPANNFSEAGINAGITQQLTGNLRYKINYTFRNSIMGNDLFTKLWKAFPAHKIALTVNYSASSDFDIWSRLSYFSPSEWIEFSYLKNQSFGMYDESINNGVLWDIALKKFFSNRLIRTNIVLRNILNQKEYYNPIGAEFNLRLFIQVIVNLDNLPE